VPHALLKHAWWLSRSVRLRSCRKEEHNVYQLHLLFDKHYAEQSKLIDAIAERIQLAQGNSVDSDTASERCARRCGRSRGTA
jgi:starvation-inducible DNA-binding protein